MATLEIRTLPKIRHVEMQNGQMIVHLDDGRTLSVPISWYPRLTHATAYERENWQLFAVDTAIEWPDLDEHIGIEGLIAGWCSQESDSSFSRWLKRRNGG